MAVTLNPYLHFIDSAAAAMAFYQGVFGGELTSTTFAAGGVPHGPGQEGLLMHAQLTAEGLTLMAADTPPGMPVDTGSSISISLSGDDESLLRGYWEGLAAGATVTVPFEKAPWGDTFGMLTDQFGVAWMVNLTAAT